MHGAVKFIVALIVIIKEGGKENFFMIVWLFGLKIAKWCEMKKAPACLYSKKFIFKLSTLKSKHEHTVHENCDYSKSLCIC